MLNRIANRYISIWQNVPQGPPDAMFGILQAYLNDPFPSKVNLGIGAYRDDDAKPWILTSVSKAKQILYQKNLNHEYAAIDGIASFRKAATKLAYGDSVDLERVVSIQCLSGTGSLRLGSEFIKKFYTPSSTVYFPVPTWGNAKTVAVFSGLETKDYQYYDPNTKGLNYEGMIADIEKAPDQSIIYLHACAHNPTGVDLNEGQWDSIVDLFKQKKHFAFFDSAYQGFASGDAIKDAYGVRKFTKEGIPICLAQSFAKNFGLYGERVGQFSLVCESKQEAERVSSQLKIFARPMYSNPPINGARIVDLVLNTPELEQMWFEDIKTMSGRIISMRAALQSKLKENGSQLDWTHIVNQIGMFAYTGLDAKQSKEMADKHHIYMTMDGRISMAGLNTKNIDYVAKAFHEVTKQQY